MVVYASKDDMTGLPRETQDTPRARSEWPFESSWSSSEDVEWDSWDDWTEQDDEAETPLTSQNSHHTMLQEDDSWSSNESEASAAFVENQFRGGDGNIAIESSSDDVPWLDRRSDYSGHSTQNGGALDDTDRDMHCRQWRWSSPWSDFSSD